MLAWMISAGFAFALAASHPIMNGVRDCCIARVFADQAAMLVTTSRWRSDRRCRYLAEGGSPRPFFRLEQDLRWRWYCWLKRNRLVHK